MFFNFGPFNFGIDQENPRPRQQPPRNNNQGMGIFGGFNDFLQNNFMNPLFQPVNRQQPRRQSGPQPTFQRGSAQQKQKKEKQKQKQQEIHYNENTGMYWKKIANNLYKQQKYQQALTNYNKAIQLNNTESIFFSNRARCLKKLGKYQQALKDAQQAVQLDVDNIKGHLLSGQILAQIGKRNNDLKKIHNSIIRLKKALTLCYGQKKNEEFQQQISTYIYRAKKLLWYLKLEEVKNQRLKAITQYQNYLQADTRISKQDKQDKLNQFIQASNQDIIFQIPDYLSCQITLDLMEDPVVTDSGQVYERTAIQQHIQRNGKTDPFTRKPISGNLYPCIAIKKAIQDFLQKNPWAYEYVEGQSHLDICF